MAIDGAKLFEVITRSNVRRTRAFNLILAYAMLKEKLDNVPDQSSYFKKGLESHQRKLKELKSSFEGLQDWINSTSMDEFIASKNALVEKMEERKARENDNFVARLLTGGLRNKLAGLNELIALKAKVGNLRDLGYYLENPDELNELP